MTSTTRTIDSPPSTDSVHSLAYINRAIDTIGTGIDKISEKYALDDRTSDEITKAIAHLVTSWPWNINAFLCATEVLTAIADQARKEIDSREAK